MLELAEAVPLPLPLVEAEAGAHAAVVERREIAHGGAGDLPAAPSASRVKAGRRAPGTSAAAAPRRTEAPPSPRSITGSRSRPSGRCGAASSQKAARRLARRSERRSVR